MLTPPSSNGARTVVIDLCDDSDDVANELNRLSKLTGYPPKVLEAFKAASPACYRRVVQEAVSQSLPSPPNSESSVSLGSDTDGDLQLFHHLRSQHNQESDSETFGHPSPRRSANGSSLAHDENLDMSGPPLQQSERCQDPGALDSCSQEPEPSSTLKFRELLNTYDDLLEEGHILPGLLDVECVRDMLFPTECSSPAVPRSNRGQTSNTNVTTGSQRQRAESAEQATTCAQRPVPAPSVTVPASAHKKCGTRPRRIAFVQIYRSEHQNEARSTQRTARKLNWTPEEDSQLLCGLSAKCQAEEIRLQNCLAHRTAAAIRSRKALLRKKNPTMFDARGNIEMAE